MGRKLLPKTPERLELLRKRRRDAQKKYLAKPGNRERHRLWLRNGAFARMLKKHGLSREKYQTLYDSQNGLCAICFKAEETRRFAVDHCHKTGRVRGLLCAACNAGIGMLQDSATVCRAAISYLKKHD